MRAIQLAVACVAVLVVTAGQVQAGVITVTDTVTGFNDSTGSNPPNPFTITFTGLPTNSVAGGVLNLVTFGDFDAASEYIDISIDGVSFGRLWDNNTANDSFEGTVLDDDRGQQYGSFGTNPGANLVLSEAVLDGFLADGTVVIGFDNFGPGVDNLQANPNEFITATLEYQSVDVSAVPEPSSLALFGIGACIAGLGAARRRRREKQQQTTV